MSLYVLHSNGKLLSLTQIWMEVIGSANTLAYCNVVTIKAVKSGDQFLALFLNVILSVFVLYVVMLIVVIVFWLC